MFSIYVVQSDTELYRVSRITHCLICITHCILIVLCEMVILSESPCANYALIIRQRNHSTNSIVFADKLKRSETVLDHVDYEKLYEVPLWVYWRRNAVVYGSFVVPTTAWDYRRKELAMIDDAQYSYDHGLINGIPVRRRNRWYISNVDIVERAKAWLQLTRS